MPKSLEWLIDLLDKQIAEIDQETRRTRRWAWGLLVGGGVFCVAFFFVLTIEELPKFLSIGPNIIPCASVYPFNTSNKLRRQLALMSGLRDTDTDALAAKEVDHYVELVKGALRV